MAPNDVGVQTRLASVRMGMGDPDAAMGDLEHTLELAPKLPAVSEALFFAALATGDTNKASEALDKIRAAQGQTEVVGNLEGLFKLAQIDFPGAKATFTDLVQKYPDFMPGEDQSRPRRDHDRRPCRRRSDPDRRAGQTADRRTRPDDGGIRLRSDKQAGRSGRRAGARPSSRSEPDAYHRDPGGCLHSFRHGPEGTRSRGSRNRARTHSTDILEPACGCTTRPGAEEGRPGDLHPTFSSKTRNFVGARRQLVALLIEAGDFESARNVLTAGIAANPRRLSVVSGLRHGRPEVDRGIDAALATADRLQSQDRDFPGIKALKGDIYLAANRPADAVAAYTEANNAAPSSLLVTRLAGALLRSGPPETPARCC